MWPCGDSTGAFIRPLSPVPAMARRPKVPFRERYRVSKAILGQSVRLFRKERDLWVYPVLSFLVALALFLPLLVGFRVYEVAVDFRHFGSSGESGLLLGLFFLVMSYPATVGIGVIHLALVHDLFARFEGRSITKRVALHKAWRRIGTLARFNLVAMLIGGFFSVIGVLLEKLRIVPYLGRVADVIGMMAWTAATFFVIPVMAVENQSGAFDSIRRSAALARNNWGKAVSGIITLGLAIMIPVVAVYALFAFAALMVVMLAAATDTWILLVVSGLLAGGALLIIVGGVLLASFMTSVYRVVLYRYSITGQIAEPFSEATVVDAWAPYRAE